MKKIAIALVLCLIVVGGLFAQDYSFSVNIDRLKAQVPIRNEHPLGSGRYVARNTAYEWYFLEFPADTFPANLQWSRFNRVRVVLKYFRANGQEIRQGSNNAMVVFVYDPKGDHEGPPQTPGPNTPIKIFNVGGANGNFRPSGESGAVINPPLNRAPGGMTLQKQGPDSPVRFIELQEITFFEAR